jgi:hypothetical protein
MKSILKLDTIFNCFYRDVSEDLTYSQTFEQTSEEIGGSYFGVTSKRTISSRQSTKAQLPQYAWCEQGVGWYQG